MFSPARADIMAFACLTQAFSSLPAPAGRAGGVGVSGRKLSRNLLLSAASQP